MCGYIILMRFDLRLKIKKITTVHMCTQYYTEVQYTRPGPGQESPKTR